MLIYLYTHPRMPYKDEISLVTGIKTKNIAKTLKKNMIKALNNNE